MSTWLVTGGAGFIGSHIVDEILLHGERVIVLDDLSTGRLDNLLRVKGRIRFVKADIRNVSLLRRLLKGVHFVSHQAALRSVVKSIDDPMATNDVNISGTLSLLWECRKARVKRVIYASSSSVYGDSKRTPQKEEQAPSPISPYAVSKLAAENYCRVFSRTFGLDTVSLRYFNVFGPRQSPHSKYAAVVPIFMRQAKRREPFTIEGNGRQSRDFTPVKNVAQANWQAAHAREAGGETFNIACGESHSVLALAQMIARLAGYHKGFRYLPARPGDVKKTFADISKAHRRLGWKPSVSFERGLSLTWAHF